MARTPIRTFSSTPTEAEIYSELRRLNPKQSQRQAKLLAAVLALANCNVATQIAAYAIADVAGPEMRPIQPTPRNVMRLARALTHYSKTFLEATAAIEEAINNSRRNLQ